MKLACINKCALNYDAKCFALKGNMENDKLKHSSLDIDAFEQSTKKSTTFLQSQSVSLYDETKLDTFQIHSKVF